MGVGVTVAVAVGVGLGGIVAVAVALAVGVGVGLGVGVGVGLIVLAVCMAIISLSDNALFQIAACWTLPLAYASFRHEEMHQTRSIARAPGRERSSSRADIGPIYKESKRRSVTPKRYRMPVSIKRCSGSYNSSGGAVALRRTSLRVDPFSPMFARLILFDAELEIARALSRTKSVPPFEVGRKE